MSYRRVEIHWVDSTSRDDWADIDEHTDAGHLIKTIGYYIKEHQGFHILVMNIDTDGGDASMSMRIPVGCVKKIKPLI